MAAPNPGPLDVSLALFSGLNTELAPTDVPEGVSPDNQDVVFLPGSTQSRPCLSKLFGVPFAANPGTNYAKTYRQPNGNPLNLYLDSLGVIRTEDVINSPGQTQILASIVAGCFCNSVTAENGKEYFAFHDGNHGVDIPRQYDGQFFDRVSQDGPAAAPLVADAGAAGSISAGYHQCVVIFLTRQGYLTKPSPPVAWNAAGGKQVFVDNLPIGPPNVIARVLAFTGSGGANFFTLLQGVSIPNAGAPATVVAATVIPDNTTKSITMDFSDNALFNATAIDIAGFNLFNLVVLAPCLSVEAYADRLFWNGEFNKIQRFLNMGFEGGVQLLGSVIPLGWVNDAAGGALVNSPSDFGLAWQITGDGSGNPRGRLTQGAYQNYLFNAILAPSTPYTFVCWAKSQFANQAGNLVCDFFSPTAGILATAQIQVKAIPSASGAFVQAQFTVNTPAIIPADTVLRLYAVGLAAGQNVWADELMIVFTQQPYRDSDFRVSYVRNPESYDGVTGDLGPESDASPIRLAKAAIRDSLHIITGERLHVTRDNSGEPSTWTVSQVADKCGGVSPRCAVSGKNWMAWVSQNDSDLSLSVLDGGDVYQISQEIQGSFSGINQDAMQAIWAVNDTGGSAKRIYVAAPSGNNVTPNLLLPLDYRELDTAGDLATRSTIHISLTGKMVASDLARKWTRWNIFANCGAILSRSRNRKQFCVGSGPNAIGATFGNVYLFDPNKFTDDDYGQFFPYYTTYFFVNHEMEQQLGAGVHRKFFDMFSIFVTGVGLLQVTPLADRLDNPMKGLVPLDQNGNPTVALSRGLKNDIELSGEVSAERCAFKISVVPAFGATDVSFNLQHLSCRLKAHPVSQLRGRVANG